MEEKLLSIVVLPYSKAQILKSLLAEEKIDCVLETISLVQGTRSTSIRVKILEHDIERAVPIMEKLLGKEFQKKDKEVEKQILVPIDFSLFSRKTSVLAFNLAKKLNAKLILTHSYINPYFFNVPIGDVYPYNASIYDKREDTEEKAHTSMKLFLKNLILEIGEKEWSTIETEFILKAGRAEDDILAYANLHEPILIILGTHGETNQSSDLMGSVAADVIFNAKVPVLAIPSDAPIKNIDEYKNILYATDFDEKDFAAIAKLMQLTEPYDKKVYCIHIGNKNEDKWEEAKLEGMKNIFKKKYQKQKFECQLLEGDDILLSLEKYIQEKKIDILSLTTHKRNMISRVFNPGVARKMVFHTKTPLLIFHA